jgi:putative acetyltransferase
MSNFSIRAARSSDTSAIIALLVSAFEGDGEARLIESLSRDGDIVLSLVAESKDKIVGSVIYSRLLIDGDDKGAAALAPLAVLPGSQGMGVGAALVRKSLAWLREAGEHLVFVLGDPGYYTRFGFSVEAARGFRTPYDGPYLMMLALNEGAAGNGVVAYAKAFAELD